LSFRHLCVIVLLFAGVGVEAICCLGLIALRDPLDRLHCAGAAGLGAALVAAAVVVQDSFSLIGNKAAALGFLLLFANPVLVHVTARTARIRALGDWRLRPGEDVEVEAP
jgi:multisubunit Na+/H+ antiporter MnhG subunit